MYQNGPGQPPVPSISRVLLDLPRGLWKWYRSLGRGSQVALIGVVLFAFAMHGCGGGERADRAGVTANPMGTPAGATPTPDVTAPSLQTGNVPVDLDRETKESAAEAYSFWLDELGDVDVDGDSVSDTADDLDRLANSYGGNGDETQLVPAIPGKGSRVRSDLGTAARNLKAGQKALDKGQYGKAEKEFARATRALDDLRGSVRKDLVAVERINAFRLTRDGAIPADALADSATVISWIDGDTVDTDQGRVRVLGINTPEMREQCQPAQAAKEAAAQLAPPGQRVKLVNPESVQDTDKYGRLLRYVDVAPTGVNSSPTSVDVGYSLLLSSLAEPRYDSQDGYQWHPREAAYRSTKAKPEAGATCPAPTEKSAFVLASTLAAKKGDDEYWRHNIVNEVIAHPYRSAAAGLGKVITSVRKDDEKAERAEKAAAERADRALRAELARQRESTSSGDSDSSSSSSSSGDGYPGYTGPRCYAAGGGSWKPC